MRRSGASATQSVTVRIQTSVSNSFRRFQDLCASSAITIRQPSFLKNLPSETSVDNFTLAHGSPRQPVWEYILDPRTADANFGEFETDYCLVGHSHLPLIFQRSSDDALAISKSVAWNQPSPLSPRMILNPGSVGQPRDLDPRAAYAILNLKTKTWEGRRAAYEISEVQLRMLKAGLPERQALRLVAGW